MTLREGLFSQCMGKLGGIRALSCLRVFILSLDFLEGASFALLWSSLGSQSSRIVVLDLDLDGVKNRNSLIQISSIFLLHKMRIAL